MKNFNLENEQVDNSLNGSRSEEFGEEIPNAVTIAALKEVEEMIAHPKKYKRYSSFDEILKEILADEQ
ncbi:MAG: hypothetical protein NC397_10290 [Clostridium sp.]|nr:hypothetical protein [Clostridium sp.]